MIGGRQGPFRSYPCLFSRTGLGLLKRVYWEGHLDVNIERPALVDVIGKTSFRCLPLRYYKDRSKEYCNSISESNQNVLGGYTHLFTGKPKPIMPADPDSKMDVLLLFIDAKYWFYETISFLYSPRRLPI